MSRSLPPRPDLTQLKHQAKDILKAHAKGDPTVCEILRGLHRFKDHSDEKILGAEITLAEAQFVLALDYGFTDWEHLKSHVALSQADPGVRPAFNLVIEVCGCPVRCNHCWAGGHDYPAMPLADIERILEQGAAFSAESGLDFRPFPMHEFLNHPQAPEILRIFRTFYQGSKDEPNLFEPIATDAVPLATSPRWREILDAARDVGTTTFWFTFHGIHEVHDGMVHRDGAYQEICLAVERVSKQSFGCACNAYLTKPSLRQFSDYLDAMQRLRIGQILWGIAEYSPTERLRQYEAFRPEMEDLLPVVEAISKTQAWGGEWWLDMESRTETSYCAQALSGDWPDAEYRTKKPTEEGMGCVCTSDLDLHSGTAFLHGKLHGNLRTDDAREVFKRASAHGSVPWESLFFSTDARPTVQELARTHGDQNGRRVYRDRAQMRLRWLDLALEEHRMF